MESSPPDDPMERIRNEYEKNLFLELQAIPEKNDFKLKIPVKNFKGWKESAPNDGSHPPIIIVVFGDTHAGKSTLMPILLNIIPTLEDIITRKGRISVQNHQGTSANICMQKSVVNNYTFIVLDSEGTEATNLPWVLQILYSGMQISNTTSTLLKWIMDNPQKRRDAVEALFPLISVLLSDIVVYIDVQTFASNRYFEKMVKLFSKLGKIHNLTPDLILIHNKCNIEEVRPTEELTKMFLETEERDHIGFRSVHCFTLPNFDICVPKRNSDNVYIATFDGAENWLAQVSQLNKTILEIADSRVACKREEGLLLSERTWFSLVQFIINDFPTYKELTKPAANHQCISVWDAYIYLANNIEGLPFEKIFKRSLSVLHTLLNEPDIDVDEMEERYFVWKRFSVQAFAFHLVKLAHNQLGEAIDSNIPTQTSEKYLHMAMEHLFPFLADKTPCFDTQKRLAMGNKEVYARCTKTRKGHEGLHSSPLPFLDQNPDDPALIKTWKSFWSLFGVGYPATWRGPFTGKQTMLPNQEDLDLFAVYLNELWESKCLAREMGVIFKNHFRRYFDKVPVIGVEEILADSTITTTFHCPVCLVQLKTAQQERCPDCNCLFNIV